MGKTPMRVFTRYDQSASTEETNHFLQHVAGRLAERLSDTPLKAYVGILLRGEHIRELCELELRYDTLSVDDVYLIAQIKAFFQKREDLDLGVDKEAVASTKFLQAERLCEESNEIFSLRARGRFSFRPRVEAVLFAAQRKIARILGDVPELSELRPRFGSGANTTIKKAISCARNKLGAEVTASSELLPSSRKVLAEMPGWTQRSESGDLNLVTRHPDVRVDVGVVEFVRKTWKTDRAIVKEPILNTMFQLGIGDLIADRLLKGGCDLVNGQTVNRRKAREGSLTGKLATLDLSSASDTISIGVVYDLLPFDWAEFLWEFRTGTVLLNGATIKQQKFSSMGNGFTFPLESLLFYAISSSVSDEAYVFGDDIIVETDSVDLLVEVLTACGFLVNKDKSFVSGPFRESCGGDYLNGIDVRPCFVKNRLSAATVMTLHNFFAARYDDELTGLFRRRLAEHLQLEGPAGYGDGHLHVAEPRLHRKRVEDGWAGYCFDTFISEKRTSVRISKGDYVLPCYSTYLKAHPEPEKLRVHRETYSGFLRTLRSEGLTLRDRSSQGTEIDSGGLRRTSLGWTSASRPEAAYDKQGQLQVTIPGSVGYRRITIYLLSKP